MLFTVTGKPSLDILTEKGQKSLAYEEKMLNIISSRYAGSIIETDKTCPAKCDGFLTKNGILTGVFESKCRDISSSQMEQWGTWLITNEKVEELALLSKMLCVPFFGFLYCIKDDVVFVFEITNSKGMYNFKFDVKKTITQETINGGQAERLNAFLPMSEAQRL